ncbi:hypothetical protein [Natrinema salsiterrestre]|uniref:Uncharacterized protein n=1 Tax=Natrinema salsiterrestre TaxID=2950540 RepID=A0A9Q4KY98_9EURY|nr:hypothetical protein [Natrinema salsiterrestre]MDF9746095.1 hypothetical protein [Natrinema salsiterrestre]
MVARLPNVRHPRSFYDVFTVVAAAVAIIGLVLAVRYGSVIRLEMAVFMAIVFVWVGWAIGRILERSEPQSNGGHSERGRRRKL